MGLWADSRADFTSSRRVIKQTDVEQFTQDFQDWLKTSKYSSYDFVRADLGKYGSYGGRASKGQQVAKNPVVFIHGNSDTALFNSGSSDPQRKLQTGWTNSIQVQENQCVLSVITLSAVFPRAGLHSSGTLRDYMGTGELPRCAKANAQLQVGFIENEMATFSSVT